MDDAAREYRVSVGRMTTPLTRFATRDGQIYQAWQVTDERSWATVFWRRIEELPADAEIRD